MDTQANLVFDNMNIQVVCVLVVLVGVCTGVETWNINMGDSNPGRCKQQTKGHTRRVRPLQGKDILPSGDCDFIVVGAGTTGAPLAYKMARDNPNWMVCIVEGGRDDLSEPDSAGWRDLVRLGVHGLVASWTFGCPIWAFESDISKFDEDTPMGTPLGSTWGGTSANNAGTWLQPTRESWQKWEDALGNPQEWSWNRLMQAFTEIENRGQLNFLGQPQAVPGGPSGAFNTYVPGRQGLEGDIRIFQPITTLQDPWHEPLKSAIQTSFPDQYQFDVTLESDEQYPEIYTPNQISAYDQTGGNLDTTGTVLMNPETGEPAFFARSFANVYVKKAAQLPNVQVFSNSLVSNLLMDENKRVYGIEYYQDAWNTFRTGRSSHYDAQPSVGPTKCSQKTAAQNAEMLRNRPKRRLTAKREVILSAGWAGTPAILERSGIGRSDVLNAAGVKVEVDLPGVGENLVDTHDALLVWEHEVEPTVYNTVWRSKESDVSDYLSTIAIFFAPAPYADLHPSVGDFRYDAPFNVMSSGNFRQVTDVPHNNLMLLDVQHFGARGLGSVHIVSSDATKPPAAVLGMLDDEHDLKVQTEFFRNKVLPMVEELNKIESGKFFKRWIFPSEEEFMHPITNTFYPQKYREWLRRTRQTGWHQQSSAKMGRPEDPAAVADSRGRVFSVIGLRVADASAAPMKPVANPQAHLYAMGWILADMITADNRKLG